MTNVGRSVLRIEDPPLLSGKAQFAADLSFHGQLHMRVVRSPIAHGLLSNVDVSSAVALQGVAAAWSSKDVADLPPIDFRMTRISGMKPYRQPVLATHKVRYVGEPLAVVFAEDPYLAEDAAELIEYELEDLEPLMEATEEPGSFDEGSSTEAAVIVKSVGDVDAAFEEPFLIVELELRVGRQSGVPMETRGVLARFDVLANRLDVHGAAKVPHYNRGAIASMLGLAQRDVVLHESHVGGGFGIRGELYPEDVLACVGALRLKRPVKWIEDRREHLLAANHSRDQVHKIRAAVDDDGWICGVEDEFWLSQGGYVRTHAATVPDLTAALLPGPYVWPAYRATGHIRLTNKTPAGTYRAPGRYEGSFVRERLMDVIAARLGLDPVEVRRRNLIGPDAMPFDRGLDALGTAVTYDSGDYPALLDRMLDYLDYPRLKERLSRRRDEGEMVGLGFGYFVEKSGLGPFDGVRVIIDEAGSVVVLSGAASVGQGVETILAQICADSLGVPMDSIRVQHGQTDDLPFGMGAFASRVTVMSGSAVDMAAKRVRAKALTEAAALLEANEEDLVLRDGRIYVTGSPDGPNVTLGEVAKSLRPRPGLDHPGLSAEGWFEADHMTYPYGLHAAVAAVDRGTGEVRIERYVVAYDVGRAINPGLVEGQIVGAAAQGIGGALLEEFVYDDGGQPQATSFMDYLMPTVAEIPEIEVLLSEDAPSPLNPLGVKGAGEGGITACGAALSNAVSEALRLPEAVTSIPMTPSTVLGLMTT
ncbi:MAG: xanthine dehydrogenase family protein molybdopterin-binding subunit [Acidimicrobiia bacterium]|nr:xanthine dehydrogenase family protein molybdopterin-binding subunit [Acidimicrobiia bacterium]MDH3462249.1 xanthine dehydrogenase family protein molybdopterin-binding subunit [Acidimicrobiia bacterium]